MGKNKMKFLSKRLRPRSSSSSKSLIGGKRNNNDDDNGGGAEMLLQQQQMNHYNNNNNTNNTTTTTNDYNSNLVEQKRLSLENLVGAIEVAGKTQSIKKYKSTNNSNNNNNNRTISNSNKPPKSLSNTSNSSNNNNMENNIVSALSGLEMYKKSLQQVNKQIEEKIAILDKLSIQHVQNLCPKIKRQRDGDDDDEGNIIISYPNKKDMLNNILDIDSIDIIFNKAEKRKGIRKVSQTIRTTLLKPPPNKPRPKATPRVPATAKPTPTTTAATFDAPSTTTTTTTAATTISSSIGSIHDASCLNKKQEEVMIQSTTNVAKLNQDNEVEEDALLQKQRYKDFLRAEMKRLCITEDTTESTTTAYTIDDFSLTNSSSTMTTSFGLTPSPPTSMSMMHAQQKQPQRQPSNCHNHHRTTTTTTATTTTDDNNPTTRVTMAPPLQVPKPPPPRQLQQSISSAEPPLLVREIEISPGQYIPLRGANETEYAIRNNYYVIVTCLVCSAKLQCIMDCECVLCPDCRIVSPNEINIISSNSNNQQRYIKKRGVGLGLKIHTYYQ